MLQKLHFNLRCDKRTMISKSISRNDVLLVLLVQILKTFIRGFSEILLKFQDELDALDHHFHQPDKEEMLIHPVKQLQYHLQILLGLRRRNLRLLQCMMNWTILIIV